MTRTGLLNSAVVLVLMAVVVLSLVVLEWSLPYFFLSGDTPVSFLPADVYNWRSVVEEKTIPFITWQQNLGQTYVGQGQNGVFYLPEYGAIWLSRVAFGHPFAAIEILAFPHLALAPVGIYLLLRQVQVERGVSFFASLLWVTFPQDLLC